MVFFCFYVVRSRVCPFACFCLQKCIENPVSSSVFWLQKMYREPCPTLFKPLLRQVRKHFSINFPSENTRSDKLLDKFERSVQSLEVTCFSVSSSGCQFEWLSVQVFVSSSVFWLQKMYREHFIKFPSIKQQPLFSIINNDFILF